MKRRGGGEILGVMIVGAALSLAMGITVQSSAELVYGGKITVRDAVNDYKGRVSEMIQIIDVYNNPASVEMINYGIDPITIKQVRIDSANTTYDLYEYNLQGDKQRVVDANIIPTKKLVRIDAPIGADMMYILTSNANVIEIDLP